MKEQYAEEVKAGKTFPYEEEVRRSRPATAAFGPRRDCLSLPVCHPRSLPSSYFFATLYHPAA
jgi:hypothetical protein